MLKDASNGCYSKQRIRIHPHYGVWLEYIPPSEADFRSKARTIIRAFSSNKKSLRIASINAAMRHIDSTLAPINFESSEDDWVDAYWELYRHHFIQMAYSKERPEVKQMFARPSRDHQRRTSR